MSSGISPPVSAVPAPARRIAWLLQVWLELPRALAAVRRGPLPAAVGPVLGKLSLAEADAVWLGRLVTRRLHVAAWRPRCLLNALVLARLLRRNGLPAHLVIGLRPDAATKDAHAWVELDGWDIGPPPGRIGHVEMARYG
jgi:hypothetical protein